MRALLNRVRPMVRPRRQNPRLEVKGGRLTFRYWKHDLQTGKAERIRHTFPPNTSREKADKSMVAMINTINALNTGEPISGPLTFEGFVKRQWAQYCRDREMTRSTLYGYASLLRTHILPRFGPRVLSEVTVEDVNEFFEHLRVKRSGGKVCSPKYRSNIYALLSTMFEVAKENDLIQELPVRPKLHRKKVPRKHKPALTTAETRRLLEQIPAEHQALHWTVAITGLRLGELLGLQIRDLDLTLGRMNMDHDLWRGEIDPLKTESSKGIIHMPGVLTEILREHLQRPRFTGPEDFVFCRADGSPWDQDHLRNQVLYPAMDRAGIKRGDRTHGYHIFRHTAGRIVYTKTRDVKASQDLLRHSRLATTSDIYLDRDEEVAEEATEIVARELTGILETEKIQ